MSKKIQFGQKKIVNGKEYTYKQDSRGGNYGSWFLTGNKSSNKFSSSASAHDDFNHDNFDQEEAIEDLYTVVDDLESYTSSNTFRGGIKMDYPVFSDYTITRMEDKEWTEDNKNDYEIVHRMSNIVQDDTLDDEEKQYLIEQEYNKFSHYEKPYRNSFSSSYRYPVSEQLQKIGKTIKDFANTSQYRRSEEDLKHLAHLPLHNTNDGLILKEGQFGKQVEYDIYYGEIISSPYYNAGVREFIENIEPLDVDKTTDEVNFVDAVHKVRLELEDQSLQLVSIFPTKELKNTMEKYDVKNVEVESFVNGREFGNVYTVMKPDGNTMSFSVYEHRNSDSIIINGKENWDKDDELPYAADSKYDYFAEINHKNYEQAAEMLTFFMKEAQNGDLQSTEELVRNAPRIDWNTELSKQLGPSFQDFLNKYSPEEGERVRKNLEGKQTDEDILRDLDF